MGIRLKGGLPKDNGAVHVAGELDEDTGTDVWLVLRCSAEDSIRHNETGEMTHALRIQSVEATTAGAEFATRLQTLHDDMREKRTGSRQLQFGSDEGISGSSTGDESEAERQARLYAAEQEAAAREAAEDAAAANDAADPDAGTAEPAAPDTEDTPAVSEPENGSQGVPPATFAGPDASGDDVTPADPPVDLTSARKTRGGTRGRSGRGSRARA